MDEIELYYLKKKQNTLVFILLFIAMVVINTFSAVFLVTHDYREASATILGVSNGQITYEYTMEDSRVCRQVCDYSGDVAVGDTITIYYNVKNNTMVRFSMTNTEILLIALSAIIEILVVIDYMYLAVFYRY